MPHFSSGTKVTVINDKISDVDLDTKIEVEKTADEDKIRCKVKDVEALLIQDDGIVDLAKQSRARAYLSAAKQTIPTGVWTKVELDAETYDEQSEYDPTTNHRFTAIKAGYYQTIFQVTWVSTVGGGVYIVGIKKSGVHHSKNYTYPLTSNYITNRVSDIIYLPVGGYLEVWAFQSSGGGEDIENGTFYTFMAIHKLS